MITLQVPRSLALVGDDAGCQSHFGEQERPGRGRQQARSSECTFLENDVVSLDPLGLV